MRLEVAMHGRQRTPRAHFLMKTKKHVSSEMSLHVLAYNLKRVMSIMGVKPLIEAIQA